MKPYYADEWVTLYHGDARDVLPIVAAGSCSLALLDPPYHGVVEDEWDNQWATDSEFLAWLADVLGTVEQRIADNGTMYVFSSPRMASRVEGIVSILGNVIASCVWDKGDQRKGAAGTGIDVGALRTYWSSNGERCVVAEKRPLRYEEADQQAKDASGYWDACERVKRSVFGDYLRAEMKRAGVTAKRVAALFPSRTGGMTGCVSNWLLGLNCPTAEQYAAIRELLNNQGGEYLRKEYEDLRKEYEDLRKEYEDLRRPFRLTAEHQWGDIWRFPIPRSRLHPTEKPIGLIGQIIDVSTRPGDLVLDCFAGSGTTLRAAKNLGRRSIGIEREEKYCRIIAQRLEQNALDLDGAA